LHLDSILSRQGRPRRQASHEMVASVLREAITSGHLRANEPLPQDEIAAQLQVSHIPVREALRQLESEGLVTYEPNRGAMVRALSIDEIREIYDIRATLETAAVRRAAPVLTEEEFARADAILDQAERTEDGAQWGTLDVEFHQIVNHLDGRPRLQELITGLLRRVDRYWLSHGLMLKYRKEFEREHRLLLQALRERDAGQAESILAAHLAGACQHLITELSATDVTPDRKAAPRKAG